MDRMKTSAPRCPPDYQPAAGSIGLAPTPKKPGFSRTISRCGAVLTCQKPVLTGRNGSPAAACSASESRSRGIGGSSRSCLHVKHGILPFSLGKRSLLVLRFASCEAVVGGSRGIGGSSRSVRIFRPSGECAAVGRGRRKSHCDETFAVPADRDQTRRPPAIAASTRVA